MSEEIPSDSERTGTAMLSTGKSIFFIKITFVAVSLQKKPFGPGRCPAHLFADGGDADILPTFDNQFIVDMAHNSTAAQGLHGIAEDIPADGLDDVFHEFRSITFQSFPFLCGSERPIVGIAAILSIVS